MNLSPTILNLGNPTLALPLNVSGKTVTILITSSLIKLDDDTVIEFVDGIVTKSPDVSEMFANISILESGQGYRFGVPNEFWATVALKDERIECNVRDRFNKKLIETASIETYNL